MDDFYRVPLSTAEASATIAVLRVVCSLLQRGELASDISPDILESAATRIEAEIPDFLVTQAEKLRNQLAITLADTNLTGVTGDQNNTPVGIKQARRLLERALHTSGMAEIEYYVASRNEWTTRRVEVSDVYENESGWYLEGECQLRRDHRMFRLENIRAVRIIGGSEADPLDDDDYDPFDEEGNA